MCRISEECQTENSQPSAATVTGWLGNSLTWVFLSDLYNLMEGNAVQRSIPSVVHLTPEYVSPYTFIITDAVCYTQ